MYYEIIKFAWSFGKPGYTVNYFGKAYGFIISNEEKLFNLMNYV